ncbi:unnamed protein product [Larinioides sclopetarius]|uniref:Uncharacterized protein n=1 Tax=Larinioides sclopetarius TaxID=280406 RepID=A0AAV1ZI78_9ARAC
MEYIFEPKCGPDVNANIGGPMTGYDIFVRSGTDIPSRGLWVIKILYPRTLKFAKAPEYGDSAIGGDIPHCYGNPWNLLPILCVRVLLVSVEGTATCAGGTDNYCLVENTNLVQVILSFDVLFSIPEDYSIEFPALTCIPLFEAINLSPGGT